MEEIQNKKQAVHCKKLLNSVENAVRENLLGTVALNPNLHLAEEYDFVFLHKVEELKRKGKVLVLSGGGSGHEPLFAGYVGKGMLTAAIAGAVFTSPPPETVLAALRLLGRNNKSGVLLLGNNYTGDRLNFGLALERARREGIHAQMVLVAEDCALQSNDKSAGRRGLAGCILCIKIAGAMAEEGRSLEDICQKLQTVIKNMGTIGISLSPCSVPGSGQSFTLADDELELGLGIHGEAGVKRLKMCSAKDLLQTMFNHMTNPESNTRLDLKKGQDVCLLINNLGGTSQLEMNVVAYEARKYTTDVLGLNIIRLYSGTLLTSLEMAGISITVLHLDRTDVLTRYLDTATEAPAWPRTVCSIPDSNLKPVSLLDYGDFVQNTTGPLVGRDKQLLLRNCIQSACKVLMTNREALNALDCQGGDGDCGTTIHRGAQAILNHLNQQPDTECPAKVFAVLSHKAENSMGGSSGALYSLLFDGISGGLSQGLNWILALRKGLDSVIQFGGAAPGDRTMVDPLDAFLLTIDSSQMNNLALVEVAVSNAEKSAHETSFMKARAGRASYSEEGRTGSRGPDPGAHAVSLWMRAALEAAKDASKLH